MMMRTKEVSRALVLGVMLGLGACADEAATDGDTEREDRAESSIGPAAESPWDGTLSRGIESMEDHADEEDYRAALLVANRMMEPDDLARFRRRLERRTRGVSESVLRPITRALDAVGVDALTEADRGEIEFARALVLARAAEEGVDLDGIDAASASTSALERARAAGGGARADAIAALGALDLFAGETFRRQVPEIAASQGAPPPPQSVDDGEADPLEEARAFYVRAREHFIERLRMEDGPGTRERALADVRANVELTIRRLRELDAIEQERQDQQQDEEDQNDQKGDPDQESKGEKDQDSDQDEGDESRSEKGEDDASREEGEEPPPDDAPPEDEDPGEQEEQEEPADPDSTEDGESDEEQESEEPEPKEGEAGDEPSEPQISEEQMTMEELKRFFDRRREYEKEGERRRKALRIKRKIPTQRDW